MAMISEVYWQPTGASGLMAQADWLGAVRHLSHKPGKLSQCFKHDDSTVKVILVLLLLF